MYNFGDNKIIIKSVVKIFFSDIIVIRKIVLLLHLNLELGNFLSNQKR